MATYEISLDSGEKYQIDIAEPNKNPVTSTMGSYLKEAQPSFKWFASGMPQDLQGIQNAEQSNWADIYRQSGGGVLPFAKSTSTMGQAIPQVFGEFLDLGTRPASYVGGYAIPKGLQQMAINPTTRRWLAKNTPTLASKLLENNPIKPIIKNIGGMDVDITKPLPNESGTIAKTGRDLVGRIQNLVEDYRGQYSNLLKGDIGKYGVSSYKTLIPKEELKTLPKGLLGELGLKKETVTVGNLWEGRWNLLKRINGNTFYKEDLLRRTKLSEDELMNALQRTKAVVLNNLTSQTRETILKLDPKFETIAETSRGLLKSIYDPTSNKIKTSAVNNLFKKTPSQEGNRELFNRLKYFDSSLIEIQKQLQRELFKQSFERFAKETAKWTGIGLGIGYGGYGIGRKLLRQVGIGEGESNYGEQ